MIKLPNNIKKVDENLLADALKAQKACGYGAEIGMVGSVLMREYVLPYLKGLVHLKLLRKQESDPSKAIKERIYLEFFEFMPSLRLKCLNITKYTRSMVEIFRILL